MKQKYKKLHTMKDLHLHMIHQSSCFVFSHKQPFSAISISNISDFHSIMRRNHGSTSNLTELSNIG